MNVGARSCVPGVLDGWRDGGAFRSVASHSRTLVFALVATSSASLRGDGARGRISWLFLGIGSSLGVGNTEAAFAVAESSRGTDSWKTDSLCPDTDLAFRSPTMSCSMTSLSCSAITDAVMSTTPRGDCSKLICLTESVCMQASFLHPCPANRT